MNGIIYLEKYYSIYCILYTQTLNNVLMNSYHYLYFLTFFLSFFILGSEMKRNKRHYILAEHMQMQV